MRNKDIGVEGQHIGEYIRQARERLGMTQEVLAERVGKDQRAISEYEHGKRRVSAVDLPVFARALGVSLLYFYGQYITRDDLDAAMLEQLDRLPTDDARHTAIELVRVYAESLNQHLNRE